MAIWSKSKSLSDNQVKALARHLWPQITCATQVVRVYIPSSMRWFAVPYYEPFSAHFEPRQTIPEVVRDAAEICEVKKYWKDDQHQRLAVFMRACYATRSDTLVVFRAVRRPIHNATF